MITQACKKDIVELSLLINATYRGESSKKGWTTEADLLAGTRTSEEELETIIALPNHYLYKFTRCQKIIGSVLLIAKKDVLYLGMLTVTPELQNQGIGKQLLLKAEKQARLLQLNRVQMTVIGIRQELLEWYIRNGYEDTGLRAPFPLGKDDKILKDVVLDFFVLEKRLIDSK
jgi:ribosomal protein S18 acetylase RimI-like enzyme